MFHNIIKGYSLIWLGLYSGMSFINICCKEPVFQKTFRCGYLIGGLTTLGIILLILGII